MPRTTTHGFIGLVAMTLLYAAAPTHAGWTILYDHHGISITVEARAMANGVRNEVIAVQNLTSHKIFNARVVDERSLVYDE